MSDNEKDVRHECVSSQIDDYGVYSHSEDYHAPVLIDTLSPFVTYISYCPFCGEKLAKDEAIENIEGPTLSDVAKRENEQNFIERSERDAARRQASLLTVEDGEFVHGFYGDLGEATTSKVRVLLDGKFYCYFPDSTDFASWLQRHPEFQASKV